jgi:hypothetical protein
MSEREFERSIVFQIDDTDITAKLSELGAA